MTALQHAVRAFQEKERLTPDELVERWERRIQKKTLANWRSNGSGPKFIKLGSRILYPIAAVVEYERSHTYGSTQDYGKKF